jgi:hypothetical protein
MRPVSRDLDRLEVVFDDDRLVANAGLVLPGTLAQKLGVEALTDELVRLPGGAGFRPGRKLMTVVNGILAGGDCIDDCVRHEALFNRVGVRGPTVGLSQQAVEAGGSLILEAQGRVGAALTTTGRVGTARRPGSGKRDRKVYECRNQWSNPRKSRTGSNLVDMGRIAVRALV